MAEPIRREMRRIRIWESVAFVWLVVITVIGFWALANSDNDLKRFDERMEQEVLARNVATCEVGNETRGAVVDLVEALLVMNGPMNDRKEVTLNLAKETLKPVTCPPGPATPEGE